MCTTSFLASATWVIGCLARSERPGAPSEDFTAAVVAVIRATNPGDVITYGEVAVEAGYPGAARAVGNVLKNVDELPWWRVVNSVGRLVPGNEVEHASRLRAEGVRVSGGRVRG